MIGRDDKSSGLARSPAISMASAASRLNWNGLAAIRTTRLISFVPE